MWKDKMCPLQTTHECILLSLSLSGESRPLILKVINEICVLIVTTMWLILGIVVFSVYLCLNNYGIILIFMVSLVCSFSLQPEIMFCIFLRFGVMDIHFLGCLCCEFFSFNHGRQFFWLYYFRLALIVFQDLERIASHSVIQSFH